MLAASVKSALQEPFEMRGSVPTIVWSAHRACFLTRKWLLHAKLARLDTSTRVRYDALRVQKANTKSLAVSEIVWFARREEYLLCLWPIRQMCALSVRRGGGRQPFEQSVLPVCPESTAG